MSKQQTAATPWDLIDELVVPEVQAALGRVLPLSAAAARAVVLAAEPLWEALAELGMSDGYGGGEFRSAFPVVLSVIDSIANCRGCPCAYDGHPADDCPDLRHHAERALDAYAVFTRQTSTGHRLWLGCTSCTSWAC